MKLSVIAKFFTLSVVLFPLYVMAEPTEPQLQLSNVQIQYVETKPSAEEKGTPRGKARELFKKFEPKISDDHSADLSNNTEVAIQAAEKVAFENGYLDMPIPLFDALVRCFASYQVSSAPIFYSALRSKEEVEKIKNDLAVNLKPLPASADFTLSIMPYRVAYQDADNAVIWIGVLLWDQKLKKNVWTYFVSVPFGPSRKGFSEVEANRIAALLSGEMVKRGWITAKLSNRSPSSAANSNNEIEFKVGSHL